MLVQVCVHVHMATTVCACGSMCVWLSGCLDVEHFFFFLERLSLVVLVLYVQELYLAAAVTVMSS